MAEKYRRKSAPRPCAHCGAMFQAARPSSPARFCSKKCVWAGALGPEHNARAARRGAEKKGNAKRGTGSRTKYVKYRGRHMHRVVAEQMLGRALQPGEIVHHINGDSWDNRPENLRVMTQSEHAKEHSAEMLKRRMEKQKEKSHGNDIHKGN